MRRVVLVVIVALALLLTGAAVAPAEAGDARLPSQQQSPGSSANATATGSTTVSITAIAPNPIADEDAGEYVALDVSAPTNTTGWTIVDEAGAVARLPNRTLSGRTILTPDPGAVTGNGSGTVRRLDGQLQLANGGDSIELRAPDGTVVGAVAYESAPEGERYRRVGDGWQWQPAGATSLEPITTTPEGARAFVLPDAPDVVESELRDAEERIYLAGYTLTSERVVGALLDAERRGVDVRVLLDGSPVGGVSRGETQALDRLVEAGVAVTILDGDRATVRFHHAKYAVIDDRSLVLTENFKPAGTGGHSSRGWGVVLDDGEMAAGLTELFEADTSDPGAVGWASQRSDVDPVAGYPSTDSFPRHFEPRQVPVERARLLVAPDNARPELARLLRSANDSIRIQQMSIEGIDDSLLQASIAAARNGTEVEVLLSSASYVSQENRKLVQQIERVADRENLPLSADLVDPRGRFSKVHAKVAIVDDRHVVLGSLNWNPTAYDENREVVVVLTGDEIAGYYAAVFEADARDAALWQLPRGLVVAICVLWIVLAVSAAARIRWTVTGW